MGRTIGYFLGGLMLLDGLVGAVAPRWGFRVWERSLRSYFPESLDRMAKEYSRLSDPAIKYLSFWQMALAGLVLWLASQARD